MGNGLKSLQTLLNHLGLLSFMAIPVNTVLLPVYGSACLLFCTLIAWLWPSSPLQLDSLPTRDINNLLDIDNKDNPGCVSPIEGLQVKVYLYDEVKVIQVKAKKVLSDMQVEKVVMCWLKGYLKWQGRGQWIQKYCFLGWKSDKTCGLSRWSLQSLYAFVSFVLPNIILLCVEHVLDLMLAPMIIPLTNIPSSL